MSVVLDPRGTIEIAAPASAAAAMPRWREYLALTKPRIAVMGLLTVALGFMLATTAEWSAMAFGHALFGIGLIAASCSALNQWLERDSDRLMARTANRPLPSGRLSPHEVLSFGLGLWLVGVVDLVLFVNGLTALLGSATLLLYVAVYTPLKRRTSLCTAIGAIPGAMPPVLGWVAAGGELDAGAFALFATLFVWQFPHFLAIAWLYREQYAAAGMRMLPFGWKSAMSDQASGAVSAPRLVNRLDRGADAAPLANVPSRITGWMCVTYALALIPVSLLLKDAALAGDAFAAIALLLGFGYVAVSVRFLLDESVKTARQLLWFSLVYLPALLLALTWDHWRLLN